MRFHMDSSEVQRGYLCEACRRVLQNDHGGDPEARYSPDWKHHNELSQLAAAAELNCRICKHLWTTLLPRRGQSPLEDVVGWAQKESLPFSRAEIPRGSPSRGYALQFLMPGGLGELEPPRYVRNEYFDLHPVFGM